jgi:hydrophobic/amphiphilic exporter-1 (mainly G- bacteria), HAE1 family
MIESFLRNPVKVAVGVLLVCLFGTIALIRMPMQLTPEVQTPTITVETRWPGASPQEVEREIVQEQEEHLKSVEGVRKMSSESMDSMGRITLEFLVGTEMDKILPLVISSLQQVPEYPEDADEPIINTASASDRPIAWFIFSSRHPSDEEIVAFQQTHPELAEVVEPARRAHNSGLAMLRLRLAAKEHPEVEELIPDSADVTKLRRFAEDNIEARLERVPGVADSQVIGGLEDELQVVVDPRALAARSLTIGDVRTALRQENVNTSGGDLWDGKRRYVVRTIGQFRDPEEVASQLVAVRNGVPVYISDVAEVRLGFKKPDGLVRRFGASSVAINASRETGANVLDVMDGLREAVHEINRDLLAARNLELTQVYDETEYIYSSINLVNQNIVIGSILTVAVLLTFLRSGRSTLVIALAIPTSLIGTFLVLNMLGRSLNVISLAGLAFAVGMLVDNAVVVLENIYRHYQLGKPPFAAAIKGATEVWGAVVASTLTTLAVFLPVLFVEEEAGQLFRDIALAISGAVGLSLLVSVTVIPTASSRLFKTREPAPPGGRFWERSSVVVEGNGEYEHQQQPPAPPPEEDGWLARALRPIDRFGAAFVRWVVGVNHWILARMSRRLATVGVLVGLTIAISWFLWPKLEYLPTGNRNLVFGIILPPPGYNLEEMMSLGEQVEQDLRPYWDVDDPFGPEAAKLDYPVIGDFFYVVRGPSVFLGVRAANDTRAKELEPLVQKVGARLPGAIAIAKQSSLFESGLSAGRTVDVEITGPDLDRLVALGGRVFGLVREVLPSAQARPLPSLDLSNPEVHVVPSRIRSREVGVAAEDLGYTVNALVDGAYAADYYHEGDKIDLTILGSEEQADRTQDLETLPIATPMGELVTLSSLADVALASGPEQINRRERQRAITIEVSPPPEIPLEDAIELIRANIVGPLQAEGALEGGYRINLAGTADKLRDTWQALRWNVVLAVIITYLLMAALFESWIHPLVIILSVPLGAVGGVIGLRLLSVYLTMIGQPPQTLDVLTMLGFVILIGTVVNNPILIVHQALVHLREDGMQAREAIVESVRTRIRPIFMTTITTVLGLSPLVFFPGSGSELYRGLGSVVLGGLLVSTIFTLVLVPTLFSLLLELRGGRQSVLSEPPPIFIETPTHEPARKTAPASAP